MADEPFALAINCVDGRVQHALLDWIRDSMSLSRIDYLTVPGADEAMSTSSHEADRARETAVFLSGKRRHACAVIAGHWDCQGNPVSDERHREQIRGAARAVHAWGVAPRTLGVWIDEDWNVSVVEEIDGTSERAGSDESSGHHV